MPEVGLYVHIPFCPRKCGYCDFYSVVPDEADFGPLVDALLTETQIAVAESGRSVETIFIGGGTPTFLPSALLQRLLAGLAALTGGHEIAEVSVEANPASLTAEKAAMLRRCGVTRLSVGAQSFQPCELRVLDRLHESEDIVRTAKTVQQAGFEHFNLDLIFGIPGQSVAGWLDSLERAILLGVDHVACYGLTYEDGTPLRRKLDAGEIVPIGEDVEAQMYLAAIDHLAAHGFGHYEISNFALPGGRCRHNLRYWYNLETIGVGPSAATYLNGRRSRNVADVYEYMRRIHAGCATEDESETLSPPERAGEVAMLRLRLIEGIDCRAFQEQTGFDPCRLFADTIDDHVRHGLLVADDARIALTREGLLVADAVIRDFLVPEVR